MRDYIAPRLALYGTVEELTSQDGAKQVNVDDLEGEGIPPGKIPGTHDAFSADSSS